MAFIWVTLDSSMDQSAMARCEVSLVKSNAEEPGTLHGDADRKEGAC